MLRFVSAGVLVAKLYFSFTSLPLVVLCHCRGIGGCCDLCMQGFSLQSLFFAVLAFVSGTERIDVVGRDRFLGIPSAILITAAWRQLKETQDVSVCPRGVVAL